MPGVTSAQVHPVGQTTGTRQPAIVQVTVEDTDLRDGMYSVRASLRQLVPAQETYWRAKKTYAPDVSDLPNFHPTPGVVLQILRARADGWAARATYGNASGGRSCGIWVGAVPASERPLTDAERKSYPEAEVSCDGDGYSAKAEWAAAGRSYMTYALKKLSRSEARFYGFHRRYSDDASVLDPFIWDSDVTVTITANHSGWAARATFAASPGKSCIQWHGALDSKDLPTTSGRHLSATDGRIVCDPI